MHGFLQQVRDLEAEPAIVFQMLVRVMERVAEWVNIQKDKYISHGDDWGEIMALLAEQMRREIKFTESMIGEEKIPCFMNIWKCLRESAASGGMDRV